MIAEFAQFTKAPVRLFVMRKPPAVNVVFPWVATTGRRIVTFAFVTLVVELAGATADRRRPARSHVGRIPFAVRKVK